VLGTLTLYAMVVAFAPLPTLFRMAAPAAGDAALLGGAALLLWFALGLLAVGYGALGAHRPHRSAAG
jgi:hypothetical protein